MKKKCNFLHLFVKIVNVANLSDIDKQTLMLNSEIIVIGIYYCMKNEDILLLHVLWYLKIVIKK